MSQSEWPERFDDPLIGLFLEICDIAINPTVGFPFGIENFESFIVDVDVGIRFARMCVTVPKYPELRATVTGFTREQYLEVAEKLCSACGYDHPLAALEFITTWKRNIPDVGTIMIEKESFRYDKSNLPIRVLLSHYIAFAEDKFSHPEFFCWAGAWMAGGKSSKDIESLFLRHLSLYSDRGDDDGVFPRNIPGKDRDGIFSTLNTFYGSNIVYDLTRQWILQRGPFIQDYRWLSSKHAPDEMRTAAGKLFNGIFGVSLSAFEIL